MLLLLVIEFFAFASFDFSSSLMAFNWDFDLDEEGYSIKFGLLLLDEELFVFWYLILEMFVLMNLLFIVEGGLDCLLLILMFWYEQFEFEFVFALMWLLLLALLLCNFDILSVTVSELIARLL